MRIKRIVFERVLPILLFAVMVVRIFSSQTILINSEYVGLDSLLLDSKLFSALSLLGLWFGAAAALAVVTRPFYNIKSLNNPNLIYFNKWPLPCLLYTETIISLLPVS